MNINDFKSFADKERKEVMKDILIMDLYKILCYADFTYDQINIILEIKKVQQLENISNQLEVMLARWKY